MRGISFGYSAGRDILSGVGFTAPDGSMTAVLGNNGAGKSTLIKCMDRILAPRSGDVLLSGRSLFSMTRREHARECAYVPQSPPGGAVSVFDAVLLGRRPYISWDAAAEDKRIASEAIERLGLAGCAMKRVDELSGGERQKVLLRLPARAG